MEFVSKSKEQIVITPELIKSEHCHMEFSEEIKKFGG